MLRRASFSSPTLQGSIALLTGFMMLQCAADLENPEGGSGGAGAARDPLRLTDAEWRDKRKGELADTELSKLVDKVIALESSNRQLRQRETPEGSKVLSADEAKDYAAYLALGKPGDLEKTVKDGQAAITERDALKAQGAIQSAAKIAGADETVLADRLKASGLSTETREVEKDGKKVQSVFVKDESGKDLGELRAYTEANWKPYTAALFPTAAEARPAGTVITPQAGAGTAGAGTVNPITAALAGQSPAAERTVISPFAPTAK